MPRSYSNVALFQNYMRFYITLSSRPRCRIWLWFKMYKICRQSSCHIDTYTITEYNNITYPQELISRRFYSFLKCKGKKKF